jgi:Zn-dependent protease
VFLLIGGIGLPGGAVYLRRDLVRSRGWQSAISAAGPLTNIIFVLVLAVPFNLGVADRYPELAAALGALGFFEAIAVLLNLLPVPGLDGFGIIAPWLSREAQMAVRPFYNYGVLILFFLLLTVQSLNNAFFSAVFNLLQFLHFNIVSVYEGYSTLQFLTLGNRGQ